MKVAPRVVHGRDVVLPHEATHARARGLGAGAGAGPRAGVRRGKGRLFHCRDPFLTVAGTDATLATPFCDWGPPVRLHSPHVAPNPRPVPAPQPPYSHSPRGSPLPPTTKTLDATGEGVPLGRTCKTFGGPLPSPLRHLRRESWVEDGVVLPVGMTVFGTIP